MGPVFPVGPVIVFATNVVWIWDEVLSRNRSVAVSPETSANTTYIITCILFVKSGSEIAGTVKLYVYWFSALIGTAVNEDPLAITVELLVPSAST